MSKNQAPPPGLSIVKPHWRRATVVKDFGGQFSWWRVGEVVLAGPYEDNFDGHTIERAEWKGALVPLANTCYGVPANVLRFADREVPHAYCCGMDPATCDCVKPDHGTAQQNNQADR